MACEAFGGFSIGCAVFGQLMRIGIIPRRVCERCHDLWGEGVLASVGAPGSS